MYAALPGLYCGGIADNQAFNTMKRIAAALTLLLCFSPSLFAACVMPEPGKLQLPDGASSDREQMLVARKQLDAYLRDLDRFILCLDAMEKTAKGTGHDNILRQDRRRQQYNEAMAAITEAISAYDREVEAFNGQ